MAPVYAVYASASALLHDLEAEDGDDDSDFETDNVAVVAVDDPIFRLVFGGGKQCADGHAAARAPLPVPEEVDALVAELRKAAATNNNECTICMDEIDDGEGVCVAGCGHEFCRACLSSFVALKLGDAASLKFALRTCARLEREACLKIEELPTWCLECPGYGCDVRLAPEETVALLGGDRAEAERRYEHISKIREEERQRVLELVAEVQGRAAEGDAAARAHRAAQELDGGAAAAERRCGNCGAVDHFRLTRRVKRTQCCKCLAIVCPLCLEKRHPGFKCGELPRSGNRAPRLVDGLEVQDCPRCTSINWRMDGCKYMTCRCGQPYCHLCGCALSSDQHFSHFRRERGGQQGDDPFGDKCLGWKDRAKLIP